MKRLSEQVVDLFETTAATVAGSPWADWVDFHRNRLDEPLRVAVAGRIKAGKSTLLNALVGDRLAATDAGECTTIVTWYRNGLSYRVLANAADGQFEAVDFERRDGALHIDLGQRDPALIERLVVDWPASALEHMTLIDTPGIESVSTDISQRTTGFLASEEHPAQADAVLYLMRHMHAGDARFLEAFHDTEVSQAGVVNAIGVLSRADEIGVGRLDAMTSAHRIADRYATDPAVRRLCQTVIPVAGLLAETAATLREDEFASLTTLAKTPDTTEALLLSADRFAAETHDSPLSAATRSQLLTRFGLFGVRAACELIAAPSPAIATSSNLSSTLTDLSGLTRLRGVIDDQFAGRAEVLRSRSALVALTTLINALPEPMAATVRNAAERVVANCHEFSEIRLLNMVRTNPLALDADARAQAEQLLGASGALLHQRLGIDVATSATDMLEQSLDVHRRWTAIAENPALVADTRAAARIVAQSCEGLAGACRVLADPEPALSNHPSPGAT